MTASELLASLQARGVTVELAGEGQLRCYPSDVLTDADRMMIVSMKPALLALLALLEPPDDAPMPETACGLCWRPLVWVTRWNEHGAWLCASCARQTPQTMALLLASLTDAEREQLKDAATRGDRIATAVLEEMRTVERLGSRLAS